MKRKESISAALLTLALLVVGALVALPAVVALRGLGWDVSGSDGPTKAGVALGLFLGCFLLCAAVRRVVLWARVRRVNFLRVMNARIRGVVFDGAVYTDFRDLPRFWRVRVRKEWRMFGRLDTAHDRERDGRGVRHV